MNEVKLEKEGSEHFQLGSNTLWRPYSFEWTYTGNDWTDTTNEKATWIIAPMCCEKFKPTTDTTVRAHRVAVKPLGKHRDKVEGTERRGKLSKTIHQRDSKDASFANPWTLYRYPQEDRQNETDGHPISTITVLVWKCSQEFSSWKAHSMHSLTGFLFL